MVLVVEVVVGPLAVVDKVDTKTVVLPFMVPVSVIVELNSGGFEDDVCDLKECSLSKVHKIVSVLLVHERLKREKVSQFKKK